MRAELAADTEMIEWVCNESPHGVEHWVGKASDERKGEVQVAPAILSKYVGTYEEQQPYWRAAARVVRITVVDGKLVANMDGRGERPAHRDVRDIVHGLVWARRRVHRGRRRRTVREARVRQLPIRAEVGFRRLPLSSPTEDVCPRSIPGLPAEPLLP